MGRIYKTDGTQTDVKPSKRYWSLEELQEIVGGYIEQYKLSTGEYITMNEEGAINGLPVNAVATEIWRNDVKDMGAVIFGNVIICDEGEIDEDRGEDDPEEDNAKQEGTERRLSVNVAVMSHLSDAQELISLGKVNEASAEINVAKMFILNWPDLNTQVTDKELNQAIKDVHRR